MISISSMVNAGNPSPGLKEAVVSYKSGNVTFTGFVVYDGRINGKRPVVLVVPEWWGLNDYARMRARKLAELGYLAMAVDMFGEGKTAANPKQAQELTMPYYKDPALAKTRLDAAIAEIKSHPQADDSKMAAIGYCFGGFIVLNAAKQGAALRGVVSFHGGLGGAPADKELLKAKILVCHGAADKFVTQQDVDGFRHQMDSIGADYTIKIYADATHAFSNPDATKTGKEFNLPIEYNAAADKKSWEDMKSFFSLIF
jgi:dienelactone hydrolase